MIVSFAAAMIFPGIHIPFLNGSWNKIANFIACGMAFNAVF
jgi:hypothetical protein